MKVWLFLLLSATIMADVSVLALTSPQTRTGLLAFSEKIACSLDKLEIDVQKKLEAASRLRGARETVET